jgi:Domain of unknown function (DUF4357)
MGKTVTTYLIEGNAAGLKSSFISNRVCNAFFVPRAKLSSAKGREELQRPSLYLLIGDGNKVYVGETENFIERVKDHDQKKDFWNEAIVFSAKDNYLTKADVQYLECLAIERIKKANIFQLEGNKQTPKIPNLPEHQMDSVGEFFEDVKLLSSFLNYELFKIVEEKTEHLFLCKSAKSVDAKGFYDENGFTVLAGSRVSKDVTDSFGSDQGRNQILQENCKDCGSYFMLEKNIIFKSPSAASTFCLGRKSNGWSDWKDDDGKTLSAKFR